MVQKIECANGKGTNKTSKMRPKSNPKSMTNQYKNRARKRDIQKKKIIHFGILLPKKKNAKTGNGKDQENHVSLKSKIIEIHWKYNCF